MTSATATELQWGGSTSAVTSNTSNSGNGFGFEIGPLAFGGSNGSSSTTTDAISASSSFGLRNINRVRTKHQRSNAAERDLRARSACFHRAGGQPGGTRIDLHSRLDQLQPHARAHRAVYYEVVQAFRTTTQLERVERCLFIPMKLIDFSDRATIERWRSQLGRAALTTAAARMLAEFGTVLATSQLPLQIRIRPVSVVGGLSVGFLTAQIANSVPPDLKPRQKLSRCDRQVGHHGRDSATSAAATSPTNYQPPTTRIGKIAAAGSGSFATQKDWSTGRSPLSPYPHQFCLHPRGSVTYWSISARRNRLAIPVTAARRQPCRKSQSEETGGVSLTAPVAISEMKSDFASRTRRLANPPLPLHSSSISSARSRPSTCRST